jgi:hypothetical protein
MLEGFLSQLGPGLSLEIGTADGGSLECIAAHSAEVHAIDLTDDRLAGCPNNATFHKGDSKVVVPELLASFAAAGRNLDFALVDGDHSAEGVSADLDALLGSPAVARTLILIHDSFDPEVRTGIESVLLPGQLKVAGFDLDFIPGRVAKAGALADRRLGGFALVVVDDRGRDAAPMVKLGLWSLDPTPVLFYGSHETLGEGAGGVPVSAALEQLQAEFDSVVSSTSWRITSPLRALKAAWNRRPSRH